MFDGEACVCIGAELGPALLVEVISPCNTLPVSSGVSGRAFPSAVGLAVASGAQCTWLNWGLEYAGVVLVVVS
jgi:hypothetical protein